MPAATVRFTPVIVISLFTAGIVDCELCDLAIEEDQVLRQPVKFTHVPIDSVSLGVRQWLPRQPRFTAAVEQVRMRAARDQMGIEDRMHLILDRKRRSQATALRTGVVG